MVPTPVHPMLSQHGMNVVDFQVTSGIAFDASVPIAFDGRSTSITPVMIL
jgi:hypothetical protein